MTRHYHEGNGDNDAVNGHDDDMSYIEDDVIRIEGLD